MDRPIGVSKRTTGLVLLLAPMPMPELSRISRSDVFRPSQCSPNVFDPERVGFVSSVAGEGTAKFFKFDTKLPGNGNATFPIALALMVCSPLSGRLVGAGRVRLALVGSGAAMTTGALLLTRLAPGTSLVYLVVAYAIFGIGLGSVNAPITNTAVSGMPRSQAALASAIASTSRQVGASLGVALAGSLSNAGIESAHHPELASATHVVFWVIAGLGAGIVALGLASTGARARASAERVAFLLDPPARTRSPAITQTLGSNPDSCACDTAGAIARPIACRTSTFSDVFGGTVGATDSLQP